VAGAVSEAPARATWPKLLAAWATIGCVAWFLVSFARREGGAVDAAALYGEFFGARPERIALGAARVDVSGARVLDLELTPNAGEPSRLVLWQATEPGPILAAFGEFRRFEQAQSGDDAPDGEGVEAESADGARKGGSPWREIERGDLSFGAWTTAYVRLRLAKPQERERDQIRVNLSDQKRFALLVAEWAPGVASAVEPLEALLASLALTAQVDASPR
jgi:hypothetical protein